MKLCLLDFQTFKGSIFGVIKTVKSDLTLFYFLIKNHSWAMLTANRVKKDLSPNSSLEAIAEWV